MGLDAIAEVSVVAEPDERLGEHAAAVVRMHDRADRRRPSTSSGSTSPRPAWPSRSGRRPCTRSPTSPGRRRGRCRSSDSATSSARARSRPPVDGRVQPRPQPMTVGSDHAAAWDRHDVHVPTPRSSHGGRSRDRSRQTSRGTPTTTHSTPTPIPPGAGCAKRHPSIATTSTTSGRSRGSRTCSTPSSTSRPTAPTRATSSR